jgi:hypothetical protein
MKFLFFIKWCWNTSSIEIKLISAALISAYLSIVINAFAWVSLLLFLITIIKTIIDTFREYITSISTFEKIKSLKKE